MIFDAVSKAAGTSVHLNRLNLRRCESVESLMEYEYVSPAPLNFTQKSPSNAVRYSIATSRAARFASYAFSPGALIFKKPDSMAERAHTAPSPPVELGSLAMRTEDAETFSMNLPCPVITSPEREVTRVSRRLGMIFRLAATNACMFTVWNNSLRIVSNFLMTAWIPVLLFFSVLSSSELLMPSKIFDKNGFCRNTLHAMEFDLDAS
mmetsp:Transcript_23999/g.39067  ORF Transcript_23999/g.39067 Transcript_23999/m.39067 type:complete len:207 (-) Transcript_23999:1215-1835(-)